AVREGSRTARRAGRPRVAGLRRSARSPRVRRRGPSAPLADAGVAPDPRGALAGRFGRRSRRVGGARALRSGVPRRARRRQPGGLRRTPAARGARRTGGTPAVRPHPRGRLPGHDAGGGGHPAGSGRSGPRRGGRSRRARLLVPRDDAPSARPLRDRGVPRRAADPSDHASSIRRRTRGRGMDRAGLVEPLLTSDVIGLSPAAARGLIRRARVEGRAAAEALDVTEGLDPAEADAVVAARETLAKAALFAGMSVQDAFRVLWEELPCSRRLVEGAGL